MVGQILNKKHIEILKALCVNNNGLNNYISSNLENILHEFRLKKSAKKHNNSIIIKNIKNKQTRELFEYYIENYSSLSALIQDIHELINLDYFVISKKTKKTFKDLYDILIKLENGLCNIDYIKFVVSQNVKIYDSKNFINHISKLNDFVDVQKINNSNFYYLKKEKKTFTFVFDILKKENCLSSIQNSIYLNISDFNSDENISSLLTSTAISLKDKNETKQFINFKTREKEQEGISDSLLFQKFLIKSNLNQENFDVFKKIIKKNKLSSFATTLLLEHIFYISECLTNDIEINEQYFEKCLSSLYNGDAKNINEEMVK